MLMGTLCGVEMGLTLAGIPHSKGGATVAMMSCSSERRRASDALTGPYWFLGRSVADQHWIAGVRSLLSVFHPARRSILHMVA
jgi:hypothetical protein